MWKTFCHVRFLQSNFLNSNFKFKLQFFQSKMFVLFSQTSASTFEIFFVQINQKFFVLVSILICFYNFAMYFSAVFVFFVKFLKHLWVAVFQNSCFSVFGWLCSITVIHFGFFLRQKSKFKQFFSFFSYYFYVFLMFLMFLPVLSSQKVALKVSGGTFYWKKNYTY